MSGEDQAKPAAPTLPESGVPRSARILGVLGRLAFWTVGTVLGFYFGLFSFMLSAHAFAGGCQFDVCLEASWPRGLLYAGISGLTLALWLKWAAWTLRQGLAWWKAGAAGLLVGLIPVGLALLT